VTRFVAEVSGNHARDLDRARAFIDTAAAIGCDAVKFQLFRIDRLFAPEILARSAAHRARQDWELPPAFLPDLAKHCRARDIAFACTPFDLEAVAALEPFVAFYKISSYELTWDALLAACAATGRPVVLATGMATLEECAHAVAVLRAHGCAAPTLLHCVSRYPAPPQSANLAAIARLREAFGCPAGWSDHSVSPGVIQRAVHRWGAALVEFHLDLDGTGAEFAAGHCWLPEAIGRVIREIREGLSADGDGVKQPTPEEQPERPWRADPGDGLRPCRAARTSYAP
jgi:sialic acid synthase SpsE